MIPSQEDFSQALKVLDQGGIVAYPTETFYGLAVDSRNEKAIAALYRLKKREQHKPISLIVPDIKYLSSVVSFIPDSYRKLIDTFWPGPLTLIFPAKSNLPSVLTGGGNTIAVRISSHPVARALCNARGEALTATSANISGMPPLNTALDVKKLWGKQIAYVLDGGTTKGGKGSTIIGCDETENRCRIIREGAIDISEIAQQLPPHYTICKV